MTPPDALATSRAVKPFQSKENALVEKLSLLRVLCSGMETATPVEFRFFESYVFFLISIFRFKGPAATAVTNHDVKIRAIPEETLNSNAKIHTLNTDVKVHAAPEETLLNKPSPAQNTSSVRQSLSNGNMADTQGNHSNNSSPGGSSNSGGSPDNNSPTHGQCIKFQSLHGFQSSLVITARILRMTEGNIFTLSTTCGEEGGSTPIQPN